MVQLVFAYGEQRVTAVPPQPPSIQAAVSLAEDKLGITRESYDLYDTHGKIEDAEDLQRAMHSAGSGDCVIEVREHEHFIRLRRSEEHAAELETKIARLEKHMASGEQGFGSLVEAVRNEACALVVKLEKRVTDEVYPLVESLVRDKNVMQKDVRTIQEKVGQLDVQEMKDVAEEAKHLRDEVKNAVTKVNAIQEAWHTDKAHLNEMANRTQEDLHELQRYFQGKIDVCIEADGDLRREHQLNAERMQLVADDLRLLGDEHSRLNRQCMGALEESEELRTLLGQVREDNEHLRSEHGQVRTRVHCLEGTATEVWEGFAPGVLYFRQWHRQAKGLDVQLSADLQVATGRGFLANTGLVLGNSEGLAVADGPCRRFGTPGCFSSYFEIQVEETSSVLDGAGGLFVGLSVQSSEEIFAHPVKEFDGWLVGGASKALICRAGQADEMAADPDKLPATWAMCAGAAGSAMEAVKLLRAALPPRPKGEMREFASMWDSSALRIGDRVGVCFRCQREGGARLRVCVNGDVMCTQDFVDAPPAEAIGFLTPVIRLAGAGKSARLLPGLQPPARALAG